MVSEPRDREVPWGGLPAEQRPLCERLNPTGILEEREPLKCGLKRSASWGWCRQEGIGSKGSNGKYPAQDILVTLGISVRWI